MECSAFRLANAEKSALSSIPPLSHVFEDLLKLVIDAEVALDMCSRV